MEWAGLWLCPFCVVAIMIAGAITWLMLWMAVLFPIGVTFIESARWEPEAWRIVRLTRLAIGMVFLSSLVVVPWLALKGA